MRRLGFYCLVFVLTCSQMAWGTFSSPLGHHRRDLIFPMFEWEGRIDNVRRELEAKNLDALIVTVPENIFYLCGFQTQGNFAFHTLVVPREKKHLPFMITRLLESSNVDADTWVAVNYIYKDTDNLPQFIREVFAEEELLHQQVGYDRDMIHLLTTPEKKRFEDIFHENEMTFHYEYNLIEELRLVKSPLEIEQIKRAGLATKAGLEAGIKAIREGALNENRIAAAVEHDMILHGSEWSGLSPFIVSGWRASCGHATHRRRDAQSGEFIFLEAAGCYNRYHAPMMRMAYVGKLEELPDETVSLIREAESVLNRAVKIALEMMKPGASVEDVDRATREEIAKNTFGAIQQTRSAYSVGIGFGPDWGEGHILSLKPGVKRVLKENMVFHLIPWIQIPGVAGIGISETVQVTPEGGKLLIDMDRKIITLD